MRADAVTTTMVPTMATVDDVRRDLDDVVTIGFGLPAGLRLPDPGQFAMLWFPGVGEVPISYSGIGPGRRVEHTIRAVGATTAALCALRPGDPIGVRAPFGRGWDVAALAGRDVVVAAGGLGLAPLRPVIEAAANGTLGARSVRLLAGARNPETILYADQIIDRWSSLGPVLTVDHAERRWTGRVGVLKAALAGPLDEPSATAALLCGPEVMMRVLSRQFVDAGVPADLIQVSLERSMHCGVGVCGHCQLASLFTCIDGPVVTWAEAEPLVAVRER